jgi:hypothetical protein
MGTATGKVALRQQPGGLRGRIHEDRGGGSGGMSAIQTVHGSSGARRTRGGTGVSRGPGEVS